MNAAKLRVGVIGGFGAMASPMSRHWKDQAAVHVVRVHDRGKNSSKHEQIRQCWRDSGAKLVGTISELYGAGDLDGFFLCVGKNGDDLPLLQELASLSKTSSRKPFICQLSTVSTTFVELANEYFKRLGVEYANYPLTGGPSGAENATMLILASGEESLFKRLSVALSLLGRPQYFGPKASAGAQVKLMGHMMVFNGLMGICSAAAVHTVQFQAGLVGGQEQANFFDFLNSGAGGTRQWDVILNQGIRNDVWDRPFLARYGLLDAIYTAQLMLDSGLAHAATQNLLTVTAALAFLVMVRGQGLATHGILRELFGPRAKELDHWMGELAVEADPRKRLGILIERLSPELRQSLKEKVCLEDFSISQS